MCQSPFSISFPHCYIPGIRRFIKEVEEDGRIYEQLFKQEVMEQLQASGIHAATGQQPGVEHLGVREQEDDGAEEYLNELQSDTSDGMWDRIWMGIMFYKEKQGR